MHKNENENGYLYVRFHFHFHVDYSTCVEYDLLYKSY